MLLSNQDMFVISRFVVNFDVVRTRERDLEDLFARCDLISVVFKQTRHKASCAYKINSVYSSC